MGRTTSNSIILLKKYAEEKVPGGYRQVEKFLSQDDRSRIERIKPDGWVGYDLYFRLIEAMARAAGIATMELALDFGIYQVEHDTKLLHRMALKLGGPGIMILEADQIWHRYHDTGHLRIYDVMPDSASAEVVELEGGGAILCQVIRGFILAGLKLSGAKEVEVEHVSCRFHGDEFCRYIAKWKKRESFEGEFHTG